LVFLQAEISTTPSEEAAFDLSGLPAHAPVVAASSGASGPKRNVPKGGPPLGRHGSGGLPASMLEYSISKSQVAAEEILGDPETASDAALYRMPRDRLVGEILRLRSVLAILQQDIMDSSNAERARRSRESARTVASDRKMIYDQLVEASMHGDKLSIGMRNFIRLYEAGKESSFGEDTDEFECAICFGSVGLDEAFVVEKCCHTFCHACVREQVITAVNSHSLSELMCPEVGCGNSLDYRDVCNLLEGEEHVAVLEKYERFTAEDYVATTSNAVRCPKVSCQAVMIKEGGAAKVKCMACGHEWCSECPGDPDWHEGSTCEKFQQWLKENGEGDERFQAYLKDPKMRTKPCPRCKAPVNKLARTEGGACNHVTCACKFDFCWLCMKGPYKPGHYNDPGPCYGKQYYDEPETVA
jgi:E3 ubiquitin-protein ligase RNF144